LKFEWLGLSVQMEVQELVYRPASETSSDWPDSEAQSALSSEAPEGDFVCVSICESSNVFCISKYIHLCW